MRVDGNIGGAIDAPAAVPMLIPLTSSRALKGRDSRGRSRGFPGGSRRAAARRRLARAYAP